MSDLLLNYINNNIQLSKKITNIELDFKNGVYLCELLEKTLNLKSLEYNKGPKNIFEISQNFEIFKDNLKLIGISLNNTVKKEIMEGKNGAAAKLIYKIKIELNRKKINFGNILEKINKNSLRENPAKNQNYINKTSILYKKDKEEFPDSNSVFSSEKLPTFSSFYSKKIPSVKIKKIYNFRELKKFERLKSMLNSNQIKGKNEKKVSFPNINREEKKIQLNNTFQNLLPNNIDNAEESNLAEINEEEKKRSKELINNNYLTTGYTDRQMKKAHSLYDYNNTLKSLKFDGFNKVDKPSKLEKINYDRLLKYSSLYNNSLKIGINVNEVAPNIKKNVIRQQNEIFLFPNNVSKQFKDYLLFKNLEKKLKSENTTIPSSKNVFLNDQKHLIEKSMLNMANNEAKLFQNRFNKNTALYKRCEYSKQFDEKNDIIDRKKKNRKFFLFDKSRTNITFEGIKQFDFDEYINSIKEGKLNNLIIDKKKEKEKENYETMKDIVDLVIDLTELCHKSQIKLNEELIEIPEYREWNDLFIEGKSLLNIQIKKKKNQGNISSVEKTNSSGLTSSKVDNKKKLKKVSNLMNDDFLNMEFLDYLNYRGNWDIDNYVDKELYGKQLNIFNILGNDIFKLIHISSDLIQSLKQIINSKKIINNSDFELNEKELNNISVPKSNVNNNLFGEILLLNFDNIPKENQDKKYKENKENKNDKSRDNKEEKSIKEESIIMSDLNFSYIPFKFCFIGHSYSGRKTQAKLLCEKYNNLKAYSINDITQFYIDEYKKVNLIKEKNAKNNKAPKKNNANENKILEESEKYKYAFDLIEKSKNFDKDKLEELTQEKISEDIKIDLLIFQIKLDFPLKNETEINKQIQERIQKRQNLEEELKKLVEENKDLLNNDANNSNSINKKESKKISNTPKKNPGLNNIQKIKEELEKLKIESIEGFILYDFPNTFNQMLKLENILTGYIQPIDKEISQRDLQMNDLTNYVDKPFINISTSNPEFNSFINNQSLNNQKSFFNSYFFIELSEEETIKRMNNRFQDPNTGIIYHKEYSPPNPDDKKLNDRLVELKEPTNEKIKELISQFYLEYPKMFDLMNAFKNYYKIEVIEKNEVFEKIENCILLEGKKYEDGENKDVIGNLEGNLNTENNESNEVIKYIKKLKEIMRIFPQDISGEIIKFWKETQDKYKQSIIMFIKNFIDIKNKIIEQLNLYQNDFIEFLNNSSNKYKLVDLFYKKYNLLLEKFPNLKNHHLIKEEFENNIIELSGNIWKLIQERKIIAISELDRIKNQKFIEQYLELFGEHIINLIVFETKQYYNKVNIIQKFYYEFKKPRLSDTFPYEYEVNENHLLENINNYQIFVPKDKKENNKKNNQTDKNISPKLNKIYENCFKLFFYYEQEMSLLNKKLIDEYNSNNSEQSGLSLSRAKKKSKTFKKRTLRETPSNFENIVKVINDEEELSLALNNERIKYKIRILFLKNFAEKKLEEIYNVGQQTFNLLDKYIIDSVNSQNNAMNELMLKIKKQINEDILKLKIKDVELDIFDIYEKINPNFQEYNLDFLHLIPEDDKIIDYKELYNIYQELKTYEIQDNYVSFFTFFDIAFKKYLFKEKSTAFMKYMETIPFIYIYEFIKKFITKNDKGNSFIKLNEIFTILGLLNKIPPKLEQINNFMKNINDKLKFKMFLSKDDFISNKLWFESNDDKKKEKRK